MWEIVKQHFVKIVEIMVHQNSASECTSIISLNAKVAII